MVASVYAENVTHALEEMLWRIKFEGAVEDSRNGKVLGMPTPATITIRNPTQRVLVDERRNANPFFHLAEFIWMMAGSNDVRFVERFNPRMREYANRGSDEHHGAYGYRWRRHFGRDQINAVSKMLRDDPSTRRAVLGMWDPRSDLDSFPDLPCNTHIYFRVRNGALDMTVCNRSNDLLWGCMGANAVHMTLLQELIALSSGFKVGTYTVFSNNLHMYVERPDFERMLGSIVLRDCYMGEGRVAPVPLLQPGETLEQFLADCEDYVAERAFAPRTHWIEGTFLPAMKNWRAGKTVQEIEAPDWRLACKEWLDRRLGKVQLSLALEPSSDSESAGSSK